MKPDTELTLSIDNKTIELAKLHAKQKGMSINEILEYYLKFFIKNEHMLDFKKDNKNKIIKTNWKELDIRLSSLRTGLPNDYKFDRDIANER